MSPTVHQCTNCGHEFTGNYCNNCGEKIYTEKDKKVSHIVQEALHFTTHLDNKFLKTLWLYFTKPGLVSKEYCEGKRKRYFKPVSLFLIGIVIYLLFPLLQGLNIKLNDHIANNESLRLHYSKNWALHKMDKEKIDQFELMDKFDHSSPKFAKILILILLPLTALSLSIIFRKKKRYFFDHFILATEINTSIVFLFFIILPAIFFLLDSIFRHRFSYGDTIAFGSVQLILFLFVVIRGFMRFYNIGVWRSVAKCFLFALFFFVCVVLYRNLLFTLVMLVI